MAARRQGMRAKCWDVEGGAQFDLTDLTVQKRILADAREGSIMGVCLAPPCRSWGPGGNRSFRLRSAAEPWGRSCEMTDAQIQKVKLGNDTMEAALRLIEALLATSVPFIVEHPAGSYAFTVPCMQRLLASGRVHRVTCDQCQWGARWRKRTQLLFGNIDAVDIVNFERRCRGERGDCSRKAHHRPVRSGPRLPRRTHSA